MPPSQILEAHVPLLKCITPLCTPVQLQITKNMCPVSQLHCNCSDSPRDTVACFSPHSSFIQISPFPSFAFPSPPLTYPLKQQFSTCSDSSHLSKNDSALFLFILCKREKKSPSCFYDAKGPERPNRVGCLNALVS